MSNALVKPLASATPLAELTQTELATLIVNASFTWERLNVRQFVATTDKVNEKECDHYLDQWCQSAAQGDWEVFQKRLQWEGWDLKTVCTQLGPVELAEPQSLPEWSITLQHIIQTPAKATLEQTVSLPIDPDFPIPFEDIFIPIIQVARQKLLAHSNAAQALFDAFPAAVLTEAAYSSLEQGLLQRLSGICFRTLEHEFSLMRSFGQNLVSLLGHQLDDQSQNNQYNRFVNEILSDGLLSFFQKYPVLGRLVATTVDFWVEFTSEFLKRLTNDLGQLQKTFGLVTAKAARPTPLGQVIGIETSLSDPHNRGKSVILLTFSSGVKLVYKPKNLGIEVAFNRLLNWCNSHSDLLNLKVMKVLNSDSYGWVEYIEHQPCEDADAAQRFYYRAGMLLCLLYVLRATDCHNENLIASGEHFVLIDVETLLHHDIHPIDSLADGQEVGIKTIQQFWDSVLRTGLLPRWEFSVDNRIAYDISGLGSIDPQQTPRQSLRWQAINTDNMHLQYESGMMSVQKNVPYIGDTALSPNDYQQQIVKGFDQMYRFLMAQKERLLAPEGALTALQQHQVRFVFRGTRIYDTLMKKVLNPQYLQRGIHFSLELDCLSRAFLEETAKPNSWPVLRAELKSMAQLDIPYFSANTTSEQLFIGDNQAISQFFYQSSYQHGSSKIQTLDYTDLARQVALIQGALCARVARSPNSAEGAWMADSLAPLTSAQFIQEACAIAADLEAKAMQDPDGSVNWIGLNYVPESDRFQLQLMGDGLYDGQCGVALFFAALYQVVGDQRFRQLALRALQRLRQQINTSDRPSQEYFLKFNGIGGATGLGSMIYTLVKVSEFLGEPLLLYDAETLAGWLSPEIILADRQLDVLSGVAGATLGLLALYAATGKAHILEKVGLCGQQLLTHRLSYGDAPKAWQTLSERPLTGFSHGAAGISYVLLRLYALTQNSRYLAAAMEGIAYERSVFSQSVSNWPDLRGVEQTGQPTFPVQWCHGAAGIGLARLGGLGIADILGVEQEIEIALETTQQHGLEATDHLCCGNLGRAEVLWIGAKLLSRPTWRQRALNQATNVVARAKQVGAYQLFDELPNAMSNPGFFQGLAGIGYQLLRFAADDLPSILLWE